MNRPSVPVQLFAVAAALAILASVLMAYERKQRSDFSGPKTLAMGTVLKKGAMGGSRRRSSEILCWVSYEFKAADGVTRQNWRLWSHACGVAPGRQIPIEHPVGNPDVNRPAESHPWTPWGLTFFASGVTASVAFFIKRREPDEDLHFRWNSPS
jgi:hypothetical protein